MNLSAFSIRSSQALSFCLGLTTLCAVLSPLVRASARPATAVLSPSPEKGWPQFRGPRRDGLGDERGLLKAWPAAGPRLLWSATGAGRGYSSPIIASGRIYVTGDASESLRLTAYDLSGKPAWTTANGDSWLNQHQGARASVTYSAGRLYHQNAHGRLACFDATNGAEIWAVELLQRFRGENITWGLSECLVVDERAVYATAGGKDALLVALDKRDGKLLWQSEPLAGEKGAAETAGYAAPILVDFAGRRLLIGASSRHLYCADTASGKIQWTRPRPTSYAVLAMSPVLVGDSIFMSAPFGPPGALYRLIAPAASGGIVTNEEVWTTPLDPAQGGVVHANGRLYGAYYPRGGGWAALDATSGKVLYERTDLTKGAPLLADDRIYALCEDGWMVLLEPTATKFEERGRFRVATARDRDAWAHPVLHDGRLYLRYHDTIYCYDVRRES